MQIDQNQVLPAQRKPQSAPLSRITSFRPPLKEAGVLAMRLECDTDSSQLSFTLYSCLIPHYPPEGTAGNLDKRRFLENFLPASAGGGRSHCCGFQGQKEGAEQCCWILIHGHYQRSLSNASPLMKHWLFLPGVSLTHKLEQAKMHWNGNRERGAPAGPLWGPLGPPCLLQLELSPSSQKNKETIFCAEGFCCCCCCLFPVPCPMFQREKRIFDCNN